MRKTVGIIVAATAVAASVGWAGPASAANTPPSCSSGFVQVNLVYTSSYYRGKACYNESTDNWQFGDIYADGWGTRFVVTQDDLTGTVTRDDTNGSLNGWLTVYSSYPENQWINNTLCALDFSAGVYHGCSTTDVYS